MAALTDRATTGDGSAEDSPSAQGLSAEEHRSARGFSLVRRALAAVYAAAGTRHRARLARRARRLRAPVVSIGSLRVGGSGKTPTTVFVAGALRDAGHVPAVLSRGYRREERTEGALVVRDRYGVLADTRRAGDEPSLLAHLLPGCAVLVGADRHVSGVLAESRLGCTVHVLDDGFQHVGLGRTVDLLLVTREDLSAAVLPAGPLREPAGGARRADAWLVPGEELAELADRAAAWNVPRVFAIAREREPPVPLEVRDEATADRAAPVLLVSGIANPSRFEGELRADGWRIAGHLAFRDHHPFGRADLDAIARRVLDTRAALVLTTAKDAVRLLRWRPLPFPAAMVPLTVRVEPVGVFVAWLRGALERVPPVPREP